MNRKAAGTRAELRAIKDLEAAGYRCTRSAASLGVFDVIAVGPKDVRLIQVKRDSDGRYLRPVELEAVREELRGVPVPDNCTRELWLGRVVRNRWEWLRQEVVA